MRCFLAVDLDSRLKENVVRLQKDLKGLDVSITKPESLHFTLKFLDEVDVKTVNEVERRISSLAADMKPFVIAIEGVGVFPNEKLIRVIWLGGDGLLNLQIAVENSLAGLPRKENPVPHLTIARTRSQAHHIELAEFINKNKDVQIGNMRVGEIKLKKSVLTTNGPVYEDVKVFELVE